MARCRPCPACQSEHGRALGQIDRLKIQVAELQNQLKAAETERDAALWQMRANAEELDRGASG